MSKEIKVLCTVCGGVIGGTVTDSETGEHPCKGHTNIDEKKKHKWNSNEGDYWKNGRETHNTQQL